MKTSAIQQVFSHRNFMAVQYTRKRASIVSISGSGMQVRASGNESVGPCVAGTGSKLGTFLPTCTSPLPKSLSFRQSYVALVSHTFLGMLTLNFAP